MTYKYGIKSQQQLATCHPDLQMLFAEVIKFRDCTILKGHRGEQEQNAAFASGNSKLKWPDGNHNSFPSNAVDAAPCPVEFPLDTDSPRIKQKKIMQFCEFAGYVRRVADEMGIKIRWGGDWDGDIDLKDNQFDDLVHFELVK